MKLLNTPEAAAIIRRPPATLRYWRSIGEGPPSFRLGGSVVYDEGELFAWITTQKTAEAARRQVAS